MECKFLKHIIEDIRCTLIDSKIIVKFYDLKRYRRNFKLNLVRLLKKYSHKIVHMDLKLYDLKRYRRNSAY